MSHVAALYDAPDTPSALTRPLFLTWVAAGFPSPADDHLDRGLCQVSRPLGFLPLVV
jgi:hypothetical protein